MSEVLTIGTGSATIYGTFAGSVAYFDTSSSDSAVAYRGLLTDTLRKQKLVDATRYLNRLGYVTGYTTFALRDAVDLGTGDADAAFPFRAATYEFAALASADPDVLVVDDQGSNVSRVYAGGAGVDFFSQTSALRGTAPTLPSAIGALIGPYLATADIPISGGTGDTGCCENPFGTGSDNDRTWPW